MASQIRREKVYGNFKARGLERRQRARDEPKKERPGMSEAHLALIRQLPCAVTGKTPAGEAHHLKAGTGERGMGMRSTDRWAIPLRHDPHMELERQGSRNEVAWLQARGIADPLALAEALWAASGDLERMTKIVSAHRSKK
jgi:hypothetical protein